MAVSAYLQSLTLGAPDWVPLADGSTVLQATVTADARNTGAIDVRYRGGPLSSWPPGAAVSFERVDLAELEVRGAAEHRVLAVGYAPGARLGRRRTPRLSARHVPYVEPQGGGGQIGNR